MLGVDGPDINHLNVWVSSQGLIADLMWLYLVQILLGMKKILSTLMNLDENSYLKSHQFSWCVRKETT